MRWLGVLVALGCVAVACDGILGEAPGAMASGGGAASADGGGAVAPVVTVAACR